MSAVDLETRRYARSTPTADRRISTGFVETHYESNAELIQQFLKKIGVGFEMSLLELIEPMLQIKSYHSSSQQLLCKLRRQILKAMQIFGLRTSVHF